MLNNNQFTHTIPTSITSMQHYFYSLFIDNNHLTGTITPLFGSMRSLQILGLSRNLLTGSVPSRLSSAQAINTIAIQNNLLTSTLPATLSQLNSLVTFFVNDTTCSPDRSPQCWTRRRSAHFAILKQSRREMDIMHY